MTGSGATVGGLVFSPREAYPLITPLCIPAGEAPAEAPHELSRFGPAQKCMRLGVLSTATRAASRVVSVEFPDSG